MIDRDVRHFTGGFQAVNCQLAEVELQARELPAKVFDLDRAAGDVFQFGDQLAAHPLAEIGAIEIPGSGHDN